MKEVVHIEHQLPEANPLGLPTVYMIDCTNVCFPGSYEVVRYAQDYAQRFWIMVDPGNFRGQTILAKQF